MPSSGRVLTTAPPHAGVYEYTATLSASVLSFWPPKVGASALMMSERMKTPTIAITKVKTAKPRPGARGRGGGAILFAPAENGGLRPDDRPADEAGHGANGGERHDVARDQVGG